MNVTDSTGMNDIRLVREWHRTILVFIKHNVHCVVAACRLLACSMHISARCRVQRVNGAHIPLIT